MRTVKLIAAVTALIFVSCKSTTLDPNHSGIDSEGNPVGTPMLPGK